MQTQKILVLGAGYVCAPLIEYLHRDTSISITLGSSLEEDAKIIANNYCRVESIVVDVIETKDYLKSLIGESDIVVSLLPYQLHHIVAEICIDYKVNMVTASYCNDEMLLLHEKAVEAGVTIVNEVGLDPGIDHLLAMECFEKIHEAGGLVESFVSYCGGLPAPEFSNNPLRYKFSWSPKGVLMNMLACAKYLKDSKEIKINAGGELMHHVEELDFLPGFAFEGFPNRDSVKYAELYGIAAEVHTLLRGSLRYKGYVEAVKSLFELGLIDLNPHPVLHPKGPEITWRQLICSLLGLSSCDIFYENLKTKISDKIGEKHLKGVEQLGLLEDDLVVKMESPLETLSHFLQWKLSLSEDERDLVVLYHSIVVGWPVGRKEHKTIGIVEYGQSNGKTAMARLVGLPAAIASHMVLNGEIQQKGMVLPFSPDIYRPMLARLRLEGLNVVETTTTL